MNNKGFTLVELLVTIGLVAVITIFYADFLINLVNASVKIQNKSLVEQNYTFVTTKLTKMIQEADSVEILSPSKIKIFLNSQIITIELVSNSLVFNENNTNYPLVSSQSLTITSNNDAFSFVSTANPQQVRVKLNFIVDPNNEKLRASQEFDRTITVRKSYKN